MDQGEADEAALVQRAQQGEVAAYEELVRRHRPAAYRAAVGRQNLGRTPIDDAKGVLELLWLLLTTVLAWVRPPDPNTTACSASHLGQAALDPGSPLVCELAGAFDVCHARHGRPVASSGARARR